MTISQIVDTEAIYRVAVQQLRESKQEQAAARIAKHLRWQREYLMREPFMLPSAVQPGPAAR